MWECWVGGNKKAGVALHVMVLSHAGLLFDRPPATSALPFV
jgi:hypothetical protein